MVSGHRDTPGWLRGSLTCIDLRWPHLATGTRGHYSELRQRLNDYADQGSAGPGPRG